MVEEIFECFRRYVPGEKKSSRVYWAMQEHKAQMAMTGSPVNNEQVQFN